ncbi:hypothetical protein HanOQP8_Chr15g0576391 [Helianthus annuus]|nr:hypothetical protein HanOQP8_Chr15g0576391 [Helianthus annuus]
MIPNITQNKNNIRFQKHSLISFFILEQPNRHITSEFRNYETTSEFRIDRHSEGMYSPFIFNVYTSCCDSCRFTFLNEVFKFNSECIMDQCSSKHGNIFKL